MAHKRNVDLSFMVALAVAGFALGACSSSTKQAPSSANRVSPVKEAAAASTPVSKPVAKPMPKPEPAVETAVKSAMPVGYAVDCGEETMDLADVMPGIAKRLSGQKYKLGKTDCSGMLNQVQVALQKKCPAYKAPGRADSRAVAKRMMEDGKLVLIKDPEKQAHLIKPGAVMFFGEEKKDFTRTPTDLLFIKGKGIKHVSVIVKTELKDGAISKYQMFHGRHPGVLSGTSEHDVESNRKRGRPLYGNWWQPWVAIAPLAE